MKGEVCRPADTTITRYYCKKCEKEMLPTGVMLMCHPPKYPHSCGEHTKTLDRQYPVIEHADY